MQLKEKIKFWIENAEYDLQTAELMHKSARYAYTAFMCQQAIEKIIKAIYLQENEKEAPRSHNLAYLIGLLKISSTQKLLDLLGELSSYYLEGRYPTYKEAISHLINKEKSKKLFTETKEHFNWLKSQIK